MILFYINCLFHEYRRKNIVLVFFYNQILIVVLLYVLSFSKIVPISNCGSITFALISPLFSSILEGEKKKVILLSQLIVKY